MVTETNEEKYFTEAFYNFVEMNSLYAYLYSKLKFTETAIKHTDEEKSFYNSISQHCLKDLFGCIPVVDPGIVLVNCRNCRPQGCDLCPCTGPPCP